MKLIFALILSIVLVTFAAKVIAGEWGYFAKEYGLEQVPIEIEGKSPKPAQLIELIHYARKNNIRIIFVQPQFSQKSAKVVAKEINGKVIFADPLAEDWFENLRDVAEKFKLAVK